MITLPAKQRERCYQLLPLVQSSQNILLYIQVPVWFLQYPLTLRMDTGSIIHFMAVCEALLCACCLH